MSSFLKPLKNQRGSAILFSVFLMSLLIYVAMEVSKDAAVEYQASLNAIRRVQAFHAAEACTSISLLRIKAYQQASRSLAKSLPNPSILDMIWSFPLAWPVVPPKDISQSSQDSIKSVVNLSTFKNQFSSQISTESGKIDINDLASPSEGIKNKTRQQILDLFGAKLRDQSDWSKKYYNFRFEDLINHMTDWIDADRSSLMGGDEGSYYSEMRSTYIPPNQAFKTLEELHMVKMMEDEIYEVLVPRVTLYGGKGINVNYADEQLLMALDPQITKEVAAEIMKRRNDPALGGPFADEKDFFGFLGNWGVSTSNFNENKIPMYFDSEINFNISCIGVAGKVTREITTIVYDYQKVQARLSKSLASDMQDANNDGVDDCAGLVDAQLYECQCKDKTGPDKEKCINDKKAAAQKTQNQDQGSANQPLPAGPPHVIFRDVK